MRVKQRNSAFLRRTLSIYSGQKKRHEEWKKLTMSSNHPLQKQPLPYTLDEFRETAALALSGGTCCYCTCKLTLGKLTPDHKKAIAQGGGWGMDNIVWCCQSCNWQKGKASGYEFKRLLMFMDKYLSLETAADVKRRLSIGGKWSPR